jgi:8-oxo-dGTP diphosphatase
MAKNDFGYEVPDGVTVDAIIVVPGFKVVTIRRGEAPFKGMLALPGGHIDKYERSRDAVIRETKEETGLTIDNFKFIDTYDIPGRDPRGWCISHLYFGVANSADMANLKAGDDAKSIELISPADLLDVNMAFDHSKMVKDLEWHKYV